MSRTLFVGSNAAAKLIPGFRAPKDDDRFSDLEVPGTDTFWHPSLEEWLPDGTFRSATLDELYTIKISHQTHIIGNDLIWNKHLGDIIVFERNGAQFLPELHDLLAPIWKEEYRKNKTVLVGKSKEQFFDDAVKRVYDHDSLHRSVAIQDEPMYERILKDGSPVDCSWEKFEALTREEQLILCHEEVAVTALERILIPNDYKGSPMAAYHWAFRRVCTSLFKNKWATFVLRNAGTLSKPLVQYKQWHLDRKDRLIPLEES